MKRVVLVGSDFSPSSLPPALRLRFFASHLPEFGWQPTVLTVDPRFYEAAIDPENARLLPDWLEVIRTGAIPQRVSRRAGVGDIGLRSLVHHALALDRLCRRGDVDLVFIPIPPNFPVLLGRLMYERHGVPYVVDYIDPWVDEYYARLPIQERPGGYKWRLSYALARILEPVALRHAAHLVGVSTSYTAPIIARYPWLTDADHTGIPYGGEPGDVEYVRRHPRRNSIFDPDDGAVHISYVGRGGADMHPTLRAVFAAVRAGLDQHPALFRRLRLHFVGTTYDPHWDGTYDILPLAREVGAEELVSEHPRRVPYLDALQIMIDSHALLAVGSDQPHYTASKIFPFILAERPLLAVFHRDSTVVDVLSRTGAGDAVTFSDEGPGAHVSSIHDHLLRLLSLPAGTRPATCWDAFDQYTARSMSRRLAAVFDDALRAAGPHVRAKGRV